jgi:uncharacterized protein YraI/uncharacterized membrane protein YeaQ/YmgE (transglycosylase-associated protein family)
MNFDDDDFDNFDDFTFDDDNADLRSDVGGSDFGSDLGSDFNTAFDDELGEFDQDMDELDEFDELGDEFGFDEDEVEESSGPSRTFIMLAGAMIVLFIVSLIVVVVLATRPTGPSNTQMTASAVVAINSTRQVEATATAFANATLFAEQTIQAAASPTPTIPPAPTFISNADVRSGPDPAFEIIGSATAGEEAAILAVNPGGDWLQVSYSGGEGWVPRSSVNVTTDLASVPVVDVPTPEPATPTLSPFDLTSTALVQPTEVAVVETPEETEPAVSQAQAVAMTATALAELFVATPTPETGLGTGGGGEIAPTAAMPDTGFIDDVLGGNGQGVGAFLLMALGLVGVIVVSRRLRTVNSNSR